MGKVDVEFVGWYVGAFSEVAQIAEVTLLGDLAEVGLVDSIDLHRVRLVNQIKQGRECIAQTDATAASVTDVKNPLQLLVERAFIPKILTLPIQRVPSGCVNTAFSHDLLCSWLRKDSFTSLLVSRLPNGMHYRGREPEKTKGAKLLPLLRLSES